MSIYKVAVTGGAASGKSSVCEKLVSLGCHVISSDQLAREVVMPGEPAYESIIERFGSSCVSEDKSLNRQYLRKRITEDKSDRAFLESVVQPEIISLMYRRMALFEKKGYSLVVAEVPLLFELELEHSFDFSVLISTGKAAQIVRLSQRDCVTEEGAKKLIALQLSDDEKRKRADFIIDNNELFDALMQKTGRLYEDLKVRSSNKTIE